MDPITAFSLVCGVIQVIDFGTKVLVRCRRLHKEGSLEEHKDMEDIAEHLFNARAELDQQGGAYSMGMQLSPSDKRLSTIARECSAISVELLAKIQSLKTTGRHSRRETLSKVLKNLWKQKEIVALGKKLESYRSALNTQILITLSQRSDLASFQESPEFKSLDINVQQLVANVADGHTKLDELQYLTQKENNITRQHIDDALQHQMEHLEMKEYQKQLLESLWFQEIFSREERVADAHERTFEWIFGGCDEIPGSWDNFVRWLESGEGTYWMNGKAGSGKSTLMSFVCRHQRTRASLEVWSGAKMILTPRFYFWANGTFLEKSIEGLLRSLIWQILTTLVESQSSEYTQLYSPGPSNQRLLAVWTERRLRSKLREITEMASQSYRVCFFIDGLDEFAGEQYDLIECIQDITKSREVKVCLSSRSYYAFDQAFGGSARLRLQDLTRDDIRKYVTDELQAVTRPLWAESSQPISLDNIISKILRKADGVFLWVSFAVKDQMLGLRNGDSLAQLQERIEILPSDVEGIYANMLDKIAKPYRKEAAIYLTIILQQGLPLKVLAIMTHSQIDEILTSPCPLPEEDMVAFSYFIKGRIMTTCTGLLEVKAAIDPSKKVEDMESCRDWNSGESAESSVEKAVAQSRAVPEDYVDFMHRTAADFIRHSAQGKEFLSVSTPKTFQYEVYSMKVDLYTCRQLKVPEADYLKLNFSLNIVLRPVKKIETRTGRVLEGLCDLIDVTLSRLFDREEYTNELSNPPWVCYYHKWRAFIKPLSASDKALDLDLCDQTSAASYSWHRSRNARLFKQIPFLCLAILEGLFQYVKYCLEVRASLIGHHETSRLLFCAVYDIFTCEKRTYVNYCSASFSLTRHFLKAGADPNLEICSMRHGELLLQRPTTWSLFLISCRTIWYSLLDRGQPKGSKRRCISEAAHALRKSRSDYTSAFISNGADLNAIAQFWVAASNHGNTPEDKWYYDYAISLSVRTITELWLPDEFALPRKLVNLLDAGESRPEGQKDRDRCLI